jgi:DNA repair ATPase RecN
MPKINHVKKAAKDQQNCGRCGTEIKKGDAYKWIKPRYGSKKTRCSVCAFRNSDLTGSDKLSRVYSAVENVEDFLADWDGDDGDFSNLGAALEEAAAELREIADEYQESCDAIRENFSDSPTADECEERADEINSFADDLENVDIDDFEFDDEQETEDHKDEKDWDLEKAREEALQSWRNDAISRAEAALSDCPV